MSAKGPTGRLTSPRAWRPVSLTKEQRDELSRVAAVPPNKRDRFIGAVEKCVASYFRVKNQKLPMEIERELKQIKKRVRSCLRLSDQKTSRPGEFRKGLQAISIALASLSQGAREFLQLRNMKVVHAIPEGWPSTVVFDIVVDPICFKDQADQITALQELLGALPGPAASRAVRGRPPLYVERALYHFLAVAFTRDTGKAASDSSPKFMAVCDEIKQVYQLTDWQPGSLARSARQARE
jgi:hypothetical protein